MAISSAGLGSGLDVNNLVSSLIRSQFDASEKALKDKLAQVNTKISATGRVKSSLSSLQSAFNSLSKIEDIFKLQAKSSDESIITATTSSTTKAKGSYQIEVQQLAKKHSLVTGYINNPLNVGTGTINIEIGKYGPGQATFNATSSIPINIMPGSESLTAVRDAINNSNAQVTASIVNDSQGSRLTVTSKNTGEDFAIRMTSNINGFTYDPTIPSPNQLSQTVPADNSRVVLNGVVLNQTTNQLSNVIDGITLNLKKEAIGTTVTVDVSENKELMSTQIKDFVKKYNEAISTIKGLTDYNQSSKKRGDLANDPQLRSLTAQLSELVSATTATWNTNIKNLSNIGISTNKNTGALELNETTLDKALTENFQEVGALFAKTATSNNNNVVVSNLGANVSAGNYLVNITQYTPGISVAGTIGGLAATSSGTTLTGSGELLGLSLNVIGVPFGGPPISISVNNGIAALGNDLLSSFTKTAGVLDENITSFNRQVTQFNERTEELEDRRTATEERYLRQFQALDTLINRLQSTNAMLSQQLSKL